MSRSSSVANVLLLLALQWVWLTGCAGGAALDQSESPNAEPCEDVHVVEQQTRTFKVSVDGTDRGTTTMLLSQHSDGTESMRGRAELNFDFIVYQYRYTSSGTEVWKARRLIQLANEADYNGDKYVVQASAQQQELAFEVNGKSQSTAADVWVTSYWNEPEAQQVGQNISLLTTDKGLLLTGTLQRVGVESLTVADESVNATRYQIRGDVDVDLWYDDEHRLIRQTARESGHLVLMDLTQITR